MMNRTSVLLAPNATAEAGGGVTAAIDSSFLNDWVDSMPPLTDKPETKKEANDGAPRPKPADSVEPGDAGTAAPAAKPEPEPEAAKPETKAAEPGDDKRPASQKDWDAYKAKHSGIEKQLREEAAAHQTRLKELEGKLAEVETKAAAKPVVDPEIKSQLDAALKRNEELTKRITVLDVTQHPDFVAHFAGKTTTQVELAKRIVGAELAGEVEKIIAMPDSEYKASKLDDLLSGLNQRQTAQLGGVLNRIEEINDEKQAAIKDAQALKEKEAANQGAVAQRAETELHAKVEQAIAAAKDPANGFSFYQPREGDEEWNQGVKRREATVRELMTSKNVSPEIIARSAFFAVAAPDILKAWDRDVKALVAERDNLHEQVKKLTAAQPGAGAGRGGATGEAARKPKPNATPGDHLNDWIAGVNAEAR